MCSTAMISNWRIDYSKYSVSLTDQKKVFFWVGGAPQMRYKTNFVSSPAPHPLSFSFLFLFFVSP